jgi:hypothetical protein
MAARVTSTGVTFSDGTSLTSKYGIVHKVVEVPYYLLQNHVYTIIYSK